MNKNLTPATRKVLYVGKNPGECVWLDNRTKRMLEYVICPCLSGNAVNNNEYCDLLTKKELVDGEECASKDVINCPYLIELEKDKSNEKFDRKNTDTAIIFYKGLNLVNRSLAK